MREAHDEESATAKDGDLAPAWARADRRGILERWRRAIARLVRRGDDDRAGGGEPLLK